jgi:hypothetical protein
MLRLISRVSLRLVVKRLGEEMSMLAKGELLLAEELLSMGLPLVELLLMVGPLVMGLLLVGGLSLARPLVVTLLVVRRHLVLAGGCLDLLRSPAGSLDLMRSLPGGYLDLMRLLAERYLDLVRSLPGRCLDLLLSLEVRLLDDLALDLGGRAPRVPPHLRCPGEGLLVGDPE